MVVYMLIDAHRLRNVILLLYPAPVRGERARTLKRIGRRMSSWLSGQLILCALMGVAMFVVFLLLGIPYALPLALLAAIGELVPVIGPILSTIPALALALLHSPWQFWSVLVLAVVLQRIENFVLVPRVMARKVELSPLAVFIAFLAGGSLLGITGAIMAIPVAAIVQVAFDEAFVARRERRKDFTRAGTLARR
jgi:predicted PurR-regulated permease PerM